MHRFLLRAFWKVLIAKQERRLQSDEDAPGIQLTDLGRRQSAGCAKYLTERFGVDALKSAKIYTSPLKRCTETLECMDIEAELAIKDDELKERCLGQLAGLVVNSEVLQRLRKGNESGMETMEEIMFRSRRALERMYLSAKGKSSVLVVVTHGGFISSVGRWAGPNTKWPRVDNGRLCILTKDSFQSGKWSIVEWNAGAEAREPVPSFGGGEFG